MLNKAGFWIWMLAWTVFTGAGIVAVLLLSPRNQLSSIGFVGAAVVAAVLAIPVSLGAAKAMA
jgi:hypothetical protein